jgi:hypothetical protein
MPFSTDLDNDILDHFFGKATWAAQGDNRYVGLSSTTPTKAGTNVTEPSGGGYARQQLTAASMDVAASSTTSSNADITFPQATADYASGADMTHMVMYDAVTVGNFQLFKSLTVTKPVLDGDTAKFTAADLDFTMGGTF